MTEGEGNEKEFTNAKAVPTELFLKKESKKKDPKKTKKSAHVFSFL